MIAAISRSTQAGILHALATGGASRLPRELAPDTDAGTRDAALEDLLAAGLVARDGDGRVRPGPRGSLLSGADVTARLTTRELGRPLEVHAVLGSSNDHVLERALAGAAPGLAVCAELQTAARGRRGSAFDARPGLGIWSSTFLPSPADPADAARLSLLAALAVAEAVEAVAGVVPAVKWPNDVRLRGRKVSGVLVEARSRGRALCAVCGIGINVHHRPEDFPGELRGLATSVEAEAGRPVSRAALLAELLGRLETWLDRERTGRVDLPSAWAPRDELAGRDVVVETEDGALDGRAAGLSADGALLVDAPGRGTVTVRAGVARVRTRT